MHKSKIKQISLAVCLALMPFSGFAAGLGKLNVISGLGEPLKADIELLSVTPEELSTLAATIASEEAYAEQGITRLGIHNNIKVEIAKDEVGSPILKLRSSQPISDPYLDMLIQVDWASGRLQREYTILLDPPQYKSSLDNAAAAPVELPTTKLSGNKGQDSKNVSSSTPEIMPPSSKKVRKLKKNIDNLSAPQNVAPETSGTQEITTKRGDTLSLIAKEVQVEGVNLDQMLAGLYENNKEAFSSGNMNRLKVGQIIKVPTKETLTAIEPQQAKQSVKLHSTNWNAYRNALAGAVAEAPVVAETEQKQSASGKIATAEDKAAIVKSGPQDVVKLSAGEKDAGKASKDSSKSFEAKILALQEETTAREKALKEAQDRTAALEKQIQDMQKLLALKSQSMTELQKNAEITAKASETKPVVKAEEPSGKAANTQETPKEAVVPSVPVKSSENTTTTQVKNVEPSPKVKPIVKTQAEPQPELGLLDSLMNAVDLTLVGGISGVALLGAGWMYLRNKRRKDLDSFERGILTSGGLRANTVFGNTTGSASTSDTSFLTDFAQSADGSMIDTNDVDPIAEAEVYMAYGRDAQAEEILKDAISKEPKRYELHLKLLEMYAARKDISAFEAIAGELYTTLGADDPTWAKVAEIGATLEPENPLYNVSKVATELSTQKLNASDFSDIPVSTNADSNFSLDSGPDSGDEDAKLAVSESFPASENVSQDNSFDMGTLDFGSVKSSQEESTSNESLLSGTTDNNHLEEKNSADESISLQPSDDNSMDFDLGEINASTVSESDSNSVADSLNYLESGENGTEAHVLDLSSMNEKSESQSADFDMNLNYPTEPVSKSLGQDAADLSKSFNDISFDLDSDSVVPEKANLNQSIEEISFDFPHTNDLLENELTTPTSELTESEPKTFDLSSISLDLADNVAEPSTEQPKIQTVSEQNLLENTAVEPQDVEIKLDLVAAYIDMDDKEGARELLEEVIKEGGPQQQLRAQKLLESLV